MTLLKYWREILLLVLAAAAFYAGKQWMAARDARTAMDATISAQGQIIAQQKDQMNKLAAQIATRDEATTNELAAMQAQVKKLATAQQIAAWLPKQLPLPEPTTIEIPPATKANPAPPATATIPQPDLPVIRDFVESCRECQLKLSVAQQDEAAKDQQLKLAGEQLSAAEAQRDAAIKAAKGGSFWKRLRSNAHWFLIGAGAGAAALCGTGHCH